MSSTRSEFQRGLLTVKIFPTVGELGIVAAEDVATKIVEELKHRPTLNMIFAAAPSQDEFLRRLVADSRIEWPRITAFHMDEYIGLPSEAPQGFGNYLRKRIFDLVPFRCVHYIDGEAADIEAECDRYAGLLEASPPDIVCLGIGENGHIAFNDPGVADFNDPKLVKAVALDAVCRQQQVNDGCFASLDQVPATAITITIPGLLRGRELFCVVPYGGKADAVYNTLYGEVSQDCPASILQQKENSRLYLTNDSARRIK